MKTLFISYCTEFEAGWGQRPDGFIIAEDKEIMMKYIDVTGNSSSSEFFWRYDRPTEIFCETRQYKEIMVKMSGDDIAHFNNGDTNNLILFKRI